MKINEQYLKSETSVYSINLYSAHNVKMI